MFCFDFLQQIGARFYPSLTEVQTFAGPSDLFYSNENPDSLLSFAATFCKYVLFVSEAMLKELTFGALCDTVR